MPRLTNCPETGKSLDGIDISKHCLTLWPSLDPNNLPNTEAAARYKTLMQEHELRKKERQRERQST